MKLLWMSVQSVFWGFAIATTCSSAAYAQAGSNITTTRLDKQPQTSPAVTDGIAAPITSRNLANAIAHCKVIIVTVPSTVELELTQIQLTPMPLTVYLSHPIQDMYSNIVIPAGTPVAAALSVGTEGVQLVADALVFESQLLPFQAASALIPPQQIQAPINPETPMLSLGTVGSGFGFLIGGENAMQSGHAAGQVTGMVLHMLSDRTTEVLNIPAQTEFVLYRQ